MKWIRTALTLAVAGLLAVSVISVAAGAPSATKQRIAIQGTFNTTTGEGTFTVIPLTPGLLKRDSGTFSGDGDIKPTVVRKNGQSVTVIVGQDNLTGKHGTFTVSQQIESIQVGGNYWTDRGTWSFETGTGAYAGLRGGGVFAAAGLPKGLLRFREEGYVASS